MKNVGFYFSNSLALALLTFCLGAGSANAQTTTGAFRLPVEARWNGVTLQPGTYSFSLDRHDGMLQVACGDKYVGMFLAGVVDREPSKESTLTLVENGGVNRVSELALADAEVVLHFSQGKTDRKTAQHAATHVIPVVTRSSAASIAVMPPVSASPQPARMSAR